MAREATIDELLKFRSDGQKTDLFLTLDKPVTVYTARVNQTTFSDPMVQVTYDSGSGTLSDVKNGMTMYVGTSAGTYDLGIVRIRKTPSVSVFYINESSEINWEDNAYLTVVDEFGLWQKHLVMKGSLALMDYDIGYTDQHLYLAPIPVMGPQAVLWLTEDTVNFEPDASNSWVLGSAISSYLWTAPGSSATSGLDSATPTITYNAVGRYRISCTVTAANGKTTTGYRYVFVYDSENPPATNFELLSCAGDRENGGWEFSIRMYDQALLADVRDRAMIILSARDWYGSTEGSIGQLDGYENIIAMGWIAGETIHWDPENNSVTFEVQGPHYWLNQIPGYPVGVEYKSTNPTVWTSLKNLTVDKGLWHLLHWRSTATAMMDIYLSGDTQYLPTAEAATGSLWTQLTTIAEQTILAKPICDALGRMFVQVDTQYLGVSDRMEIPSIMVLTQDDLQEMVEFEREPIRQTAQIYATGISYNGSKAIPLLSKAPGISLARFGKSIEIDQLLIPNQARLNELSGMVYAKENNLYKAVDIYLSQNNRLIDIAERSRLILNIGETDTVRGITFINQKFLPRRVSYEYDANAGVLLTEMTCEAETVGISGVTVPYVKPKKKGIVTPIDDYLDIDIPGIFPIGNIYQPIEIPDEPLIEPEEGATCPTDAPANGPFRVIGGQTMDDVNNYRASGRIRCVVRTASHTNKTTYSITARFQKFVDNVWTDTTDADDDWYDIYAVASNGSIIATGIHDTVIGEGFQRTGVFNAIAASEISYLLLVINGNSFTPSGDVTFETFGGSTVETIEERAYQNGTSYQIYCRYLITRVDTLPTLPNWEIKIFIPGLKNSNVIVTGNVIIAESDGHSLIKGFGYEDYESDIASWEIGRFEVANTNYLVRAFEFTHQFNGVGIRIRSNMDWTGWDQTTICDATVILGIKRVPTYRIILTGVDLYNVCPPEATT